MFSDAKSSFEKIIYLSAAKFTERHLRTRQNSNDLPEDDQNKSQLQTGINEEKKDV